MLQKGLLLMIISALVTGFLFTGCLEKFNRGGGIETQKKDLEFAVPSTANLLSVQELENLNNFFTQVKKFTGVQRESNPITLTGEEFNRVPKAKLNHPIPENVKFFRSAFYNSKGYVLESKTGVFVSQALLYGSKKDADLGEESMTKKMHKHFNDFYRVVYRKGSVVGGINMFSPVEPTKEFWQLVKSVEKHGFKLTKIPPVAEK